jgi:hypothetical protein
MSNTASATATIRLCPTIKAAIALGIRSQVVSEIETAFAIVIKFMGFDGLDTTAYAAANNPIDKKFAMASIARNFSTVAA